MQIHELSAIVTGGSEGLGRALALELARRGARVVIVARTAARIEGVVEEIRGAGGEVFGSAPTPRSCGASSGTACSLHGRTW